MSSDQTPARTEHAQDKHMNRVAISLRPCGGIARIAADSALNVYIVDPTAPKSERVYLHQGVAIGPEHVQAKIGGIPVSHQDDHAAGKLPPSEPDDLGKRVEVCVKASIEALVEARAKGEHELSELIESDLFTAVKAILRQCGSGHFLSGIMLQITQGQVAQAAGGRRAGDG